MVCVRGCLRGTLIHSELQGSAAAAIKGHENTHSHVHPHELTVRHEDASV